MCRVAEGSLGQVDEDWPSRRLQKPTEGRAWGHQCAWVSAVSPEADCVSEALTPLRLPQCSPCNPKIAPPPISPQNLLCLGLAMARTYMRNLRGNPLKAWRSSLTIPTYDAQLQGHCSQTHALSATFLHFPCPWSCTCFCLLGFAGSCCFTWHLSLTLQVPTQNFIKMQCDVMWWLSRWTLVPDCHSLCNQGHLSTFCLGFPICKGG